MRRDEQRRTRAAAWRREEDRRRGAGLVVEIRRRLVREQRARADSRARGRSRLAVAGRSRAGADRHRADSSTPSASKHRARSATVDGEADDGLRDEEILHRRQCRQQVELLQHDADVTAAEAVALRRRERREILPVDLDPAAAMGESSPAIRWSSVVLPQPEGPTTRALLCGRKRERVEPSTIADRRGSGRGGARSGSSGVRGSRWRLDATVVRFGRCEAGARRRAIIVNHQVHRQADIGISPRA